MTQPQHTPGRVKASKDHEGLRFTQLRDENSNLIGSIYAPGEFGKGNYFNKAESNTKRIEALWNAFENIPTSDIPGLMEAHHKEVEGLRAANAELYDALEDLSNEVQGDMESALGGSGGNQVYMAARRLLKKHKKLAAEGRGGNAG